MTFSIGHNLFVGSFRIYFCLYDLGYKRVTLVRSVGNFLLTPLPPWPSNTPKRVDLGQLGRKQSITNDAIY